MRKLIFRLSISLLCFSLAVEMTRLAAPLRSPHTHQSAAHNEVAAPKVVTAPFTEASAASIAETVESLREIRTDQFDNRIPTAAKPLLTRLKHQLRAFISDILNSEEGRQAAPQYLVKRILARLQASDIKVQNWEDVAYSEGNFQKPYAYGSIYGILVEEPAGHPELRVVTTTLGICCGEDTSLYVFKKDESTWRLVLAQEANDYDEVSGGQGLFRYAISPTGARGDLFVVTANVNPWCSSNWQSLRYRVLRVGPDPYQPQTLLSKEETIFLNDEPPYKLFAKENGFTLEFDGECSRAEIMDGKVSCRHVVGYTVMGDRVAERPR